jgi:cell division septum initiation protein DivIVA
MGAPGSRASDLAAQQVEQIVAAAQDAADRIRDDAQAERKDLREEGKRDAARMRDKARAEIETVRQKHKDKAEAELNEARKQAVMLGQDARREAEAMVTEAQEESERLREQTRRAVEGRVAAAEQAASQVLEEAQALSGGLRQLGRSLEDQADRILRDVQAAHKRMQADLRVESGGGAPPTPIPERNEPRPRTDGAAAGGGEEPPRRRREGANPFDELEVPSWTRR